MAGSEREGLTPLNAESCDGDPQAVAIVKAARRLVELRDRWLNSPKWVERVEEPVRPEVYEFSVSGFSIVES